VLTVSKTTAVTGATILSGITGDRVINFTMRDNGQVCYCNSENEVEGIDPTKEVWYTRGGLVASSIDSKVAYAEGMNHADLTVKSWRETPMTLAKLIAHMEKDPDKARALIIKMVLVYQDKFEDAVKGI
jgi:hypothetical protein